MISPWVAMEQAIVNKCEQDLKLRTLVIPEDAGNVRQKADQYLTITWDRINTVKRIDNDINELECLFSFTIEFKDLGLKSTVKDVLWNAVNALTGFKPFNLFDELSLVTCGYVGYSESTGYIKYSALFSSLLLWDRSIPFELNPIETVTYSDTEIDLSLWNATKLPNLDDAQKIETLLQTV